MDSERIFWMIMYRSLRAMAAAINTYKLAPPPPEKRHPFDTQFWKKYLSANNIPFPEEDSPES